jgi:hypothetical protein
MHLEHNYKGWTIATYLEPTEYDRDTGIPTRLEYFADAVHSSEGDFSAVASADNRTEAIERAKQWIDRYESSPEPERRVIITEEETYTVEY